MKKEKQTSKVKLLKNVQGSEPKLSDAMTFGAVTRSYAEYKEREKNITKIRPSNLGGLYMWDDTVQLTSVGFMDTILDDHPEIVFDLKEFEEKRHIGSWYDSIKELVLETFPTVDYDKWYRKKYEESLKRGPITVISDAILKLITVVPEVKFIFKYRVPSCQLIIDEYQKMVGKQCNFTYSTLEDKTWFQHIDDHIGVSICSEFPQATAIHVVSREIPGRSIMGPLEHNDIEPEFLANALAFSNEIQSEHVSLPYGNMLVLYKEGYYVPGD